MKIAITGATGHVGRNLCQMLIDKGHQLKALIHNSSNAPLKLPVESIHGDTTSETDLTNLCSDCDVVFHLAASISIRKNDLLCRRTNIESCTNLIKAAKRTGVKKIIHFSSIHAFKPEPSGAVINETRELALGSPVSYDHSKAVGQKMMMEASGRDLEIVVMNPTAIIGPNDFKPSLAGNALVRFYKGQNPVLIPGGYNWVDVRDVCLSAIRAIDLGIAGECYLLGGSWQSLETLANEIEKLGGHKAPRIKLPAWMALAASPGINLQSRLKHKPPLYTTVSLHTLTGSHLNISDEKARTVLGHNPRSFKETLADTIFWFRDNNYL
jgi:dihydroflavonol-4-reductase